MNNGDDEHIFDEDSDEEDWEEVAIEQPQHLDITINQQPKPEVKSVYFSAFGPGFPDSLMQEERHFSGGKTTTGRLPQIAHPCLNRERASSE